VWAWIPTSHNSCTSLVSVEYIGKLPIQTASFSLSHPLFSLPLTPSSLPITTTAISCYCVNPAYRRKAGSRLTEHGDWTYTSPQAGSQRERKRRICGDNFAQPFLTFPSGHCFWPGRTFYFCWYIRMFAVISTSTLPGPHFRFLFWSS
jgi:hypothetical protein